MRAVRARLIMTVAAAFAAVGGCGPAAPLPRPPPGSAGEGHPRVDAASSGANAAIKTALRDPHRFDCASDADCRNSCEHGAVNAAWYARAEALPGFSECEDGCDDQVAEPPRCEAGACVAYQSDPHDGSRVSRRDACTRVERE
ncbi:hypothetical protein [Nannocystis pusilla]|uniref:Lipoprotein n=1 Tax=Nannocystis pusilla TaxID=889268 RepID=A0ABS7U6L6_9BACT|nr:hypothetical protein [Nannocystis pusilla]MBZ5715906.1 hypothetical protein [Nannocystis pusilla]